MGGETRAQGTLGRRQQELESSLEVLGFQQRHPLGPTELGAVDRQQDPAAALWSRVGERQLAPEARSADSVGVIDL